MSEAFLKALRWLVLAECAVIGTSALLVADARGSVKTVMIAVVSYGIIYIMSYFWTDFRERILFISIVVFLILSFGAPYVPFGMYVLFGHDPTVYDPHYTWAGTVGFIGVPIMTLVFRKYD